MKNRFYVAIVAFIVTVPVLNGSAKKQSEEYQQATVSSVVKHEDTNPNQCCYTGTDAPLQADYNAYDVSIRVGCETYVGRYETALDYLPSVFSPNKTIKVRLTKHLMYFDLAGDREMKMGIVHHSNDHTAECGSSSASR